MVIRDWRNLTRCRQKFSYLMSSIPISKRSSGERRVLKESSFILQEMFLFLEVTCFTPGAFLAAIRTAYRRGVRSSLINTPLYEVFPFSWNLPLYISSRFRRAINRTIHCRGFAADPGFFPRRWQDAKSLGFNTTPTSPASLQIFFVISFSSSALSPSCSGSPLTRRESILDFWSSSSIRNCVRRRWGLILSLSPTLHTPP